MADHFSQDDARRIFARAAERQGTGEAPADSLTLEELEAIGQASGIDPAHVAAAAAELRADGDEPAPQTVFGLPTRIRRRRVLAVPLSDAAWEAVVEDLRATFRQTGVAAEIGRTREWAASRLASRDGVRVTARPIPDGRTELVAEHVLEANAQSLRVVAVVFAVVTLVLTVLGLLSSMPAGWVLGPAMGLALGAATLLPVGLLRHQARHAERAFGPILDRAELAARRAAEPSAPEAEPADGVPRLDLGDLGSTPKPERLSRRRRTR